MEQYSHKSVFSYLMDNTKFINENECTDFTPPFLTRSMPGLASKDLDVENELRNINKKKSRCDETIYKPNLNMMSQCNGSVDKEQLKEIMKTSINECDKKFQIRPNRYF